ncbi:hypothetical protein [Arcanobacterium haemolyticum]
MSDQTEELDTLMDSHFLDSMTMAEIALIETTIGTTLDEASATQSTIGLAIVAAHRLGVELSVEEANEIPAEAIKKLLEKAAGVSNAYSTENLEKLMGLIAGK